MAEGSSRPRTDGDRSLEALWETQKQTSKQLEELIHRFARFADDKRDELRQVRAVTNPVTRPEIPATIPEQRRQLRTETIPRRATAVLPDITDSDSEEASLGENSEAEAEPHFQEVTRTRRRGNQRTEHEGKWASSNNALLSFQQPAFGEGGGYLIPSIQSEVTSRALAFDDSSRWMNGYTLKDMIRNEHIREKVGLAPVEEPNNPEGGDKPEDSYSVWALPPSDIKDRLKSLMSALRSEFGGPAFDPHITVVGDLRLRRDEAIARFHSAVATLKPYTARIAGVAYGTFFYQCVYLLIHPSPEVVETSSHCCGHLGYKRSTPYMPHVSLIYGDLSDEEKERARKRAEEIDGSVCGLTFEVSSLALCKTDTLDKTTESWEMVELCDLTKKDFA